MKKPWLEGIEVIDVNKAVSPWGGWFETFALTAIVIAASFLTQQQDPFRLGGGFPWPVLAPLLAGLRYGFVYGFVSALLILAMLGVAINQQWQAVVRISAGVGDRRGGRGNGGGRVSRYAGDGVCIGWRAPINIAPNGLRNSRAVISYYACRMIAWSKPSPTAASHCAKALCICSPGLKRSMG